MSKSIWRKIAGWKLLCVILLALCISRSYAETAIWSDNFETNAASRWTTSSIWQIGAPTIGPASAHSSSRCATTGLNTGAAANVDARLICTNYNGTNWLQIPAANQFPRLRFWQWFNFVNAEGYVEILSFGSTNWQTISATNIGVGATANYSSGVWSRPSIDLSAFAGTSVQVAFHFTSGPGGWGTDPGWYVDDVAVVTNTPVINNPENFESGLGDWSVETGTWEVGKPTSGPNSAHGGTNCAGTVLAGNYGWNMDTRLISPPFVVPASGSPSLRFWQWYSFVNAGSIVEIKTSTGSWQSTSQTNKGVGSVPASSVGWTNTIVDLSAYSGQTIQVAFRFQSGPSGWGNAPGWYIDDIAMVAAPILTVPTNGLSIYPNTMLWLTNQAVLTPSNTVATFTLQSGPTGATLNSTNGIFSWLPTTAQVGANTITLFVTDANGLSTTNSFVVQVLPSVVLTVPATQDIYAGQIFSATCTATNSSVTNATFNYGLATAPVNAQINLTNGTVLWTPTSAQAGTNLFTVTATQTPNPAPTVTNTFFVQVALPPAPTLVINGNASLTNGFNFGFTNINGVNWQIQVSTNLLNWTLLTNATVSNNVLNILDPAATNYSRRFYRVNLP
ncbi:MAG TPA: choice-of-anchor J domain-containing protein [Verrucomicrobiae bacterium]